MGRNSYGQYRLMLSRTGGLAVQNRRGKISDKSPLATAIYRKDDNHIVGMYSQESMYEKGYSFTSIRILMRLFPNGEIDNLKFLTREYLRRMLPPSPDIDSSGDKPNSSDGSSQSPM